MGYYRPPMTEVLIFIALATLAWFWYDTMRVREQALRIGKSTCERQGVQFLDDTVALSSMRLCRDHDGRLAIRRFYAFEYSDSGNNRLPGSIVMTGMRLELIHLGYWELH